jgi:cyanate permease
VIVLVLGIAVMDLGAQALHISNQSAIYALAPEARSRLTTAYMVAYFLGGAVLSAVTSSLYAAGGWSGVCILGAVTAALALLIWAATETRARAGTRRSDARTGARQLDARAEARHRRGGQVADPCLGADATD